eukprot:CAMPEP_0206185030 /NCGR_PEP_ID=MMETSP0166-20121206/1551_1 /ASSEMBLY_ACC=CAM_ASM_000260 /TAXON_ID=95228 /ORGANISM="Vannella robusta, Strain DIVA3 518/3/11/1/6" /LENGTH=812 /DNA_ID=CAMNT_0053600119 /DNA_START=1574 /DNA_END=4007 /DNA_ORIENTATION=+
MLVRLQLDGNGVTVAPWRKLYDTLLQTNNTLATIDIPHEDIKLFLATHPDEVENVETLWKNIQSLLTERRQASRIFQEYRKTLTPSQMSEIDTPSVFADFEELMIDLLPSSSHGTLSEQFSASSSELPELPEHPEPPNAAQLSDFGEIEVRVSPSKRKQIPSKRINVNKDLFASVYGSIPGVSDEECGTADPMFLAINASPSNNPPQTPSTKENAASPRSPVTGSPRPFEKSHTSPIQRADMNVPRQVSQDTTNEHKTNENARKEGTSDAVHGSVAIHLPDDPPPPERDPPQVPFKMRTRISAINKKRRSTVDNIELSPRSHQNKAQENKLPVAPISTAGNFLGQSNESRGSPLSKTHPVPPVRGRGAGRGLRGGHRHSQRLPSRPVPPVKPRTRTSASPFASSQLKNRSASADQDLKPQPLEFIRPTPPKRSSLHPTKENETKTNCPTDKLKKPRPSVSAPPRTKFKYSPPKTPAPLPPLEPPQQEISSPLMQHREGNQSSPSTSSSLPRRLAVPPPSSPPPAPPSEVSSSRNSSALPSTTQARTRTSTAPLVPPPEVPQSSGRKLSVPPPRPPSVPTQGRLRSPSAAPTPNSQPKPLVSRSSMHPTISGFNGRVTHASPIRPEVKPPSAPPPTVPLPSLPSSLVPPRPIRRPSAPIAPIQPKSVPDEKPKANPHRPMLARGVSVGCMREDVENSKKIMLGPSGLKRNRNDTIPAEIVNGIYIHLSDDPPPPLRNPPLPPTTNVKEPTPIRNTRPKTEQLKAQAFKNATQYKPPDPNRSSTHADIKIRRIKARTPIQSLPALAGSRPVPPP